MAAAVFRGRRFCNEPFKSVSPEVRLVKCELFVLYNELRSPLEQPAQRALMHYRYC